MSPGARRAARAPALRYRPARRTDVDTLADLGARAYRVASVEKRREFYTDHPRFTLRDVRVGELDGQLVASLVLYPLRAFVRGRPVPMAGIGSVAVSPEHRRRGLGEALMRAALRELRAGGRALVMLYPFRESYYRKLGFGTCELAHQFAVSAANLPLSDESRHVRRLLPRDRERVQQLYSRAALAGHFMLERSPAWWTRRLWTYPGEWLVVERQRGGLEGYLHYDVDSAKGPFKLALSVNELVATTPEAHRALIGYLGSLREQVEEIHIATRADHVWPLLLKDAQNLHPGPELGTLHDTGNLASGAMLRLTDVRAALEAMPIQPLARGELRLEVEDPVLPANTRAYHLKADGVWHLTVSPAGVGRGGQQHLRAPVDVLAAIVSGALSAKTASQVGLVDGTVGAAETLDLWFRTRAGAFVQPFNAF